MRPLRALIVEDNPLDAELIVRELRRAGFAPDWQRVDDEARYRAALSHELDVILCDYQLPSFDGLAALRILRELELDVSFLLISGSLGEDAAVAAMREGAHDFLLKDRLGRLGTAVGQALEQSRLRRARRLAEERLQASEERFREIAAHIQEVFWIADATKAGMLYVSPAYQEIWGRSVESLYREPRSWLEGIHDADRERVRATLPAQAVDGGYDLEYRVVRPDGALRWIHDRAFPVRDGDGRVVRIVGVANDITRQRHLEEQFRQAQKMEAIGQLAGGVAHDFNNLLSVIQGNGALLLDHVEGDEEAAEFLREIQHATERAATLTRQLLMFSRRQTMQPRCLNLNQVVASMTRMLDRILGEDITIRIHPAAAPILVNADAGMMDQVIVNLSVNARDAMPQGGELEIDLEAVEVDAAAAAEVAGRRAGAFARMRVRDTGCGISADVLPRIFEPFFTTKEVGKGTGLGLATVYGIVSQHGGWIEARSVVGQGAVFEVYLPRLADVGDWKTPERAPAELRGGHEAVLVVEDDPSLRTLIANLLTRLGYVVHEARTGPAALDVWRRHVGEINLLLTDMVMPGGMSGQDLAARLCAEKPSLKVLLVSGYSADLAGKRIPLREGVNFLTKPFQPRVLAEAVRSALDA
jgi:PAS domain S-box-containing protein